MPRHHWCAERGILSSAPGAAGVIVGIPVSVTRGHRDGSTAVCVCLCECPAVFACVRVYV